MNDSSNSSSDYNSPSPYTPSNSRADDGDSQETILLPHFNTRHVLESIETKRFGLTGSPMNIIASTNNCGGHLGDDELYPFTPKNSFVDSSFEQVYQHCALNQMDTDAIMEKLSDEKFFRGDQEQ